MKKSKIDFISELLVSQKLTIDHKERLFLLVADEFKATTYEFDKIWEEIDKLKIISTDYIKLTANKTANENTVVLNGRGIHNVKNTVIFLYHFSVNENFKWFTHTADSVINFQYDEYIANAKKDFDELEKLSINSYTWKNVHNFLFGSKNPGYPNNWQSLHGVNINYGWLNIKEWSSENPGLYPINIELGVNERSPDKNDRNFILGTFDDVITEFKHVIEIRNDNPFRTLDITLKTLVKNLGLNNDFRISYYGDFKNVNVYTDVHLLNKGIKELLKWCLRHKAKSLDIEFHIESKKDFYELKIIHKGSYLSFEPNSPKIKGLGGELKKVREFLFCICDWQMVTRLSDDKFYKITLLDEVVNKIDIEATITQTEPVLGVIHILKLYKTLNL